MGKQPREARSLTGGSGLVMDQSSEPREHPASRGLSKNRGHAGRTAQAKPKAGGKLA